MGSYKKDNKVREEGNCLSSRQLLLRDLFSLIVNEKQINRNTLHDWLMRDYRHQQLIDRLEH